MEVQDKLARFIRPGLTEEHSVSVDGVRQDFIVAERSHGEGELPADLGHTYAMDQIDGNESTACDPGLKLIEFTNTRLL